MKKIVGHKKQEKENEGHELSFTLHLQACVDHSQELSFNNVTFRQIKISYTFPKKRSAAIS